MALRSLNTTLKDSLKNNEEYMYAHLIKFERPTNSSSEGRTANKAIDYSYITDASYNISWDDGTVDSLENPNGSQTYIANKLLKVGNVTETIEARASNISITLSGTALGTLFTSDLTCTSSSFTATSSLIAAGFSEGDVVLLEGSGNTNDGVKLRIDSFSNDNKTAAVTVMSGGFSANATAQEYNVSLVSDELRTLLIPKDGNYTGYINREVFIYRAHINPKTGLFIGEPFLIFKGIITNGSVKDNVTGTSQVTWSLVSHWGDFVQVNGRITQDASHRALGGDGKPDEGALIRPEYGSDLGFLHSERSVNMLATYQAAETRYKMKKRGGLAGWLGGKKVVEYTVMVDRDVDLQFNLSAKYLPVVYGVQKVSGIPIFADALNNDSNVVYLAHAICEGEIGGIIDVHIEDQSTICTNEADSLSRSSGDAQVLCSGRADRGDVLGASVKSVTSLAQAYGADIAEYLASQYGAYIQYTIFVNTTSTFGSNTNEPGGQGLQHEDPFVFTTPIDAEMVVHTGKKDQRADSRLASVATANNFKIQNDFFEGLKSTYWGPSHRLLDTAYTTTKFTIGEGETTIPEIEYVVRGKILECHNYDYSYPGTGTHSNFLLGDNVTLHKTSDDTQIGSTVQIIDKWSFYNTEGELEYRFRFSDNPQEDNNVSDFYMKSSGGSKWYMSSDAATSTTSDNIVALPTGASISSRQMSTTGVAVTLSSPSAELEAILATNKGFVKVGTGTYEIVSYNTSTNVLGLAAAGTAVTVLWNAAASGSISLASHVKLGTSASTTNDEYNGANLTLTTYDSNDIPTVQVNEVVDYVGSYRVAILGGPLTDLPDDASKDKYSITSTKGYDLRSSTNPVMQLLDYMTSKRYGKGLDIEKDIDLDSFKQAARDCDTRSKVTVAVTNASSVTVGGVYKYEYSGRFIFQGTVESVTSRTYNSTTYKEVVFKDVVGKLGYQWNDWRAYQTGDLVWYRGDAFTAGADGIMSTSTRDSRISSNGVDTITLTGPTSITVSVNADGSHASGNPIVKKWTSEQDGFTSLGYSLYDSDFCKYWAYLGWDEPEQRFVTRHQTNQIIDTSTPLFDNINSMLSQFNGMLRYSNGKYFVEIKQAAQEIPAEEEAVRVIDEGDIIGEISVSDKGQKDTYNSVTAQIIDPQNKFGGRSVTFMSSEYLKQDKGVRRQGNFSAPGITNYFNARINVNQYLEESRSGLKITFKLDQKSYLLIPGTIIKVSYSRFGWEEKYFRVDSISYNADGIGSVSAFEHRDSAYLIANMTPQGSDADPDSGNVNTGEFKAPNPPSDLSATDNDVGNIIVTWTNGSGFNPDTHTTKVYVSENNTRANATLYATVSGNTVNYPVSGNDVITRYFWVAHSVKYEDKAYASTEVGPEEGSAKGSSATVAVKLESTKYAISYDADGANPTPSAAQTLTATAQNFVSPRYRFTIDGTQGSWQTGNTTTFTPASAYFADPKTMSVEVAEAPESGDPVAAEATDSISIFGLRPGSVGVDGQAALTVILSNEAHTLPKTTAGTITYTGSGTTIRLFEGTTELTYDNTGTSNSTWKVTASGTNITAGSVTDSGSYATIADHSSMTATNATVTYTITGKRADGSAISLTKTQSLAQSVQGAPGTSVTVSSTEAITGGTRVNFSDGAYIDVLDGTNGDTEGVLVLYSSVENPTDNTTISLTAGTKKYIHYYEYTNSFTDTDSDGIPDDAHEKTFVQFVGDNGISPDAQGVIAIYSSVADPTQDSQLSLTEGTNEYVTFYEWSGTKPTTVPTGSHEETFVKFVGDDGSSTGVIILYKANTSATTAPAIPDGNTIYTISSNSVDAGADGWTITKPALTVGQYLWAIQEPYTTTGSTVTIATGDWSTPVVVDSNTKGDTGDAGLRTVQGYLYYEKSVTPGTAPAKPTGATYDFSTGEVSGTGIGTGVDTWTNTPREIDPTSSNVHYTIRYYGTETTAESSSFTVSYSTDVGVQYTNFSGVVTFSNGTFKDGGTDITTIDGGNIDTGTITAEKITVGNKTIGASTSALKLYEDCLKIFDSGNLRVKLGNLGNTTDE